MVWGWAVGIFYFMREVCILFQPQNGDRPEPPPPPRGGYERNLLQLVPQLRCPFGMMMFIIIKAALNMSIQKLKQNGTSELLSMISPILPF